MDIKVRMSVHQVWGDVDPEEQGLDRDASEKALCQIVDCYISDEYPIAIVDVKTGDNDKIEIDGESDNGQDMELAEIVYDINLLIDKAWDGQWEIAA